MRFFLLPLALTLIGLAGCGADISIPLSSSPGSPASPFTFAGKVRSGEVALAGASVQLYAAGTTGNGSLPTPLLANPVTTGTDGSFSVVPSYSCPLTTSTLYVLAKGGKLASAASNNDAAWLMAVVGPCGATTTANTSVVVNELTTAASAWALSAFLSPGGDVGASSTNGRGLTNAARTTANLVDLGTGSSPGASLPSNVTVATAKLNTLANVLHSCVASVGGPACSSLLLAASHGGTTPANTLDSALSIVRNPSANVAAVYGLSTANPVFLPALSSAPSDWFLSTTLSGGGMNDPAAIAVDGSGDVWVSSYYNVVSEFLPDGAPVFPSGLTGYGINQSYGMTLDGENNVWIANEQTSMNSGSGDVTKLSSSGAPLSGASGFASGGIFFPIGLAADTNGNIWVADYGDSNVTLLNSSGTPISGNGFGRGFVAFPVAVAVDQSHNAWVGNEGSNSVTRISPDGSSVANISCCDTVAGVAIDQGGNVWATNYAGASISLISNAGSSTPTVRMFTGGGLTTPNGIAIDGAGTAWVTNFHSSSVSALAGAATSSPGAFLSGSQGIGDSAGFSYPYGVAVDASGNVWVTNAGADTVTEIIGAAVPVRTPLVGPPQSP